MDMTFSQQIQQFVASHTILVAAWVAIFVAVIITFYKGATNKFKIVENNEATLLVNNQEGVFIDLRSDDEFHAGHIAHSVHLLPSNIKANNTQPIDKYKDRPVVLVDSNGLTSNANANLLAKQGFNQVFVLKEGISAWRAANLPLIRKHK